VNVMSSCIVRGGLLLFAIVIAAFGVAGCGKRELNELAIVTAVGLDEGKKPGTTRITAQIVRPADARGQTGAPAGATGQPIYSVSAEGRTIFEAIRNLARFSSRRVYWAHNYIVVMNEKYAKAGIKDMIDFFTRNPELRMNTWVAVTPDPASKIVSTITGLEVVPGEALNRLFYLSQASAESPRTNMMRLEEVFLDRSAQPVLARLSLKKRGISNKKPEEHGSLEQVELSGAAIFDEDRMIGWLSPRQTKGLVFFLEGIHEPLITLACPLEEGKLVTVELRNPKFQVTPHVQGDSYRFTVRIRTAANLVESGCKQNLREMRSELERPLRMSLRATLRMSSQPHNSSIR
jgi:spore germination protein KC